ncbi:MAG: response regulator [Magnetococcus sp. YQC-9]
MPEMDGLSATRLIRSDPRFLKLPILAMTAHAMEEDRQASLAAGMNGHLTKPIHRKQMFSVLTRWIAPRLEMGDNREADSGTMTTESRIAEEVDATLLLDRDTFLDLINHKRSLLRSLLGEFVSHYGDAGRNLRGMLDGRRRDDLDSAYKLVHSLKGSAGNLAAMPLHTAARELETALRADQRELWVLCLERLEVTLAATLTAIGQWLREIDADESNGASGVMASLEPVDAARVAPLLLQLDRLLARQDFASQECLEELMPLLGDYERVRRLADCVEGLDFPGARVELRSLAARLGIGLESEGSDPLQSR